MKKPPFQVAFSISPHENIPSQKSSNRSKPEHDHDMASNLLIQPAVSDELSLLPKHSENKVELKQKNQVQEGLGSDPLDSFSETRMKASTLSESVLEKG